MHRHMRGMQPLSVLPTLSQMFRTLMLFALKPQHGGFQQVQLKAVKSMQGQTIWFSIDHPLVNRARSDL
jgi:hypothetical protein